MCADTLFQALGVVLVVMTSQVVAEDSIHEDGPLIGMVVDQVTDGSRAHPFSILVEEGHQIPPLFLLEDSTASLTRVRFELTGSARFHAGFPRSIVEASPVEGKIRVPRIAPGERRFGESTLKLLSEERALATDIRIAVLPEGWISNLADIPIISEDALLFHSKYVAVVDEDLVHWDRWEEYSMHHIEAPPGHVAAKQGLRPLVERFDPSATDPDWCPGWCIRVPWGPGRVDWSISNPWDWGWSVKPENISGSLAPAAAPSQAVDGIYNLAWGCGQALKIPDSCTATASTSLSLIQCCCNHAAAALGHVCQWIDPVPLPDWPNCPI
jgi:hypothetical protein